MATFRNMNENIYLAISFANEAHKNQIRKGSGIDYIFHVLEAGYIAEGILSELEISYESQRYSDIVCAAILHDILEDTQFDESHLREIGFNENVISLIVQESEDKSKKWQERKEITINDLKNASEDEKIVTLCDKLSNMRSISKDYILWGESLWKRFKMKKKDIIGWYYKGILDSLSSLENLSAYKEYKELVENAFGN